MSEKESAELAIRGAQIAKTFLQLLTTGDNPQLSRLVFIEGIKQIKELDLFLNKQGS